MPKPEIIVELNEPRINISMEPAFNTLYGMMQLNKTEHLSGIGGWVI